VASQRDAYIGEFVSIGGKLTVFGDLEIGRNVRIKKGFEAKGLITIQDPMPVVMFLFLYLLILLRLGRLEDIENLFEEVEELESPLILPENTSIDLDRIVSSKDAEVTGSKVIGNLRVRDAYIDGSEIFGSVRGREIIVDGSIVHGTIEGRVVYLANSSEVYGQIRADRVYMEEGCSVEGSIVAKDGVWIKEKIELPATLSEIEVSELPKDQHVDELKVVETIQTTSENVEKELEEVKKEEEKTESELRDITKEEGEKQVETETSVRADREDMEHRKNEENEKISKGRGKTLDITIKEIAKENKGAENGVGSEKVQKDVS
jgi:predicted acyltransferase (DUF342 family)